MHLLVYKFVAIVYVPICIQLIAITTVAVEIILVKYELFPWKINLIKFATKKPFAQINIWYADVWKILRFIVANDAMQTNTRECFVSIYRNSFYSDNGGNDVRNWIFDRKLLNKYFDGFKCTPTQQLLYVRFDLTYPFFNSNFFFYSCRTLGQTIHF